MGTAPIVVHRIQGEGGRRVTIRGRIQGAVYSDADLIEVLRVVGVPDPDQVVDASSSPFLEWRDSPPHDYGRGPGEPVPRPAPRR
ncbi:hypothetical protein ACFV98_02510 [Streptomyces violascens]|uniref:hypothetical protein n=1 Tax=Streptomyces violascens TaxID=67381 RepID=UPI003649490D